MNLLNSNLQRLFRLVWHHGFVFFQSIRSLTPAFVWVCMLSILYDYRYPLNISQTYMTAAPWFFIIMALFGYLFLSGFNQTAEHILMLQINSRKLYASSKIIFMLAICIALSILGCVYPIMVNFLLQLKGITFFTDGYRMSDLFGSLFLHIIYGVMGMSISLLFQPDLTKRRDDFSIIMLIFFAVSSYAKVQLVEFNNLFGYILWAFPPVLDIARIFTEKSDFLLYDVSLAVFYGLLYSVAAVAVGQWVYSRMLYGPRIAKSERKGVRRERL